MVLQLKLLSINLFLLFNLSYYKLKCLVKCEIQGHGRVDKTNQTIGRSWY
jgi:hypothetical protein